MIHNNNYTIFKLNSNFRKFTLHIFKFYYYINMKKLLATFFVILFFNSAIFAADDILDLDMDLIDSPSFSNRKAVTQEQFDKAVEQKQQKNKGLILKFRDWLNRNKPENDPVLKSFESDGSGELGMSAHDFSNIKPNIVLSTDIIDSFGKVVPKGHYQVSFFDKDNAKLINFMQGNTTDGSIRAIDTTDNSTTNSIVYARISYPSADVARIIFSNLDVCVEGFARIVKPI